MNLNNAALVITYLLLSVINIWSVRQKKRCWFTITKSALMPILLGIYLAFSSSAQNSIVLALLCAWSGDVFLLKTGDNKKSFPGQSISNGKYALMAGGLAFIMCHLCYLWTFTNVGGTGKEWQLYVMLAYFLFGCWFYINYVGDFCELEDYLKIGIAIYTLVILLMSFSSILIIRAYQPCNWVPLIGTLLFMFSDYLLAVGYKKGNSFLYQVWAMALYLAAQFLIVFPLAMLA